MDVNINNSTGSLIRWTITTFSFGSKIQKFNNLSIYHEQKETKNIASKSKLIILLSVLENKRSTIKGFIKKACRKIGNHRI
jgi:hypothetical protein